MIYKIDTIIYIIFYKYANRKLYIFSLHIHNFFTNYLLQFVNYTCYFDSFNMNSKSCIIFTKSN